MVSKHIMNLTVVIILCALIALALILFPLIMSHKAEKTAKKMNGVKLKIMEIKLIINLGNR